MKRILLGFMAMMMVSVAMAQQTSHTVQRGETLESIAQKYNVSVSALKNLNPDVAEMFYVGMKLNIPQRSTSNIDQQQQATSNTSTKTTTRNSSAYTPRSSSTYTTKYKSTSSHDNTFETMVVAGLSMNSWTGNDVKNADMEMGFHAGLAGRYTFAPSLFAESGLIFTTKGYKVKSPETTMTTYNLDIPINIGYAFSLGDNMRLCFKVGPYLTYAMSGEMEVKGGSSNSQQGESGSQQGGPGGEQGGPSGSQGGQQSGQQGGPDGQQSGSDNQQGGQSGANSTKTKLKDMKNYNTFNVGINAGVSLEMGHFLVAATYQRGLGVLLTNTKTYEQNIFISVGYKF